MSKYFKKSYTLTRPSEAAVKHLSLDYIDENVRGTDGPLHLSFPDEPDNVWAKAWVDTLTGLGFPMSGDPFSGQAYGGYVNAETIDPATRQRSYSANAYLQPAKTRQNLTVITGALVEKIVLDNSNSNEVIATGVQYTKDGETKIVEAHKEVIISAGSFNSPRLLELSGIGNPEILKQHNVPVVIDNPNVGENLQNHLMCGMSFEVVEGIKTLDSLARQSPDTVAAASEAYTKGGGPFASSGTYASALLPFPNNNTAEGRRDLQQLLSSTTIQPKQNTETAAFVQAHQAFVQSVLSSPVEGTACYISFPGYASFNPDGSMAPPPQGPENYFTIAVLLAHPLSRGSVHISSASPSAPVRIDPRYLSHSLDLEVIAHHVRFIENRIIHAEPLKGLLKSGGKRSTGAPASLEEIEVAKDYVRRAGLGAHHPTGSCSMMPREKGGVVDANLRVYGCRNLHVCDASIIPITPGANPQASVYAVAERAADLLKQ